MKSLGIVIKMTLFSLTKKHIKCFQLQMVEALLPWSPPCINTFQGSFQSLSESPEKL